METSPTKEWFLRKHEDGSIFGPLPFERCAQQESEARYRALEKKYRELAQTAR